MSDPADAIEGLALPWRPEKIGKTLGLLLLCRGDWPRIETALNDAGFAVIPIEPAPLVPSENMPILPPSTAAVAERQPT